MATDSVGMKASLSRILIVTLGLGGLGAVGGAVLGGVVILPLGLGGGVSGLGNWLRLFRFGAVIGATFGLVLAPLVAWIFLRRVPLGRVIRVTTLGVLCGAGLGAIIGPWSCILLGLLGFILAGICLWVTTPPASRPHREAAI